MPECLLIDIMWVSLAPKCHARERERGDPLKETKKQKHSPIGLFEFDPFISPKRVSLVKKKTKQNIISTKKVVIIGLTLSPPPLLRIKACKNILIIYRKKNNSSILLHT